MSVSRGTLSLLALLLAPATLVSCGGGGGGGPSPAGGFRSFDVSAALTLTPQRAGDAVWTDFPRSQVFTLVWNDEAHLVFVGANGFVGAGQETPKGAQHEMQAVFSIPVPFSQSCGGTARIEYDEIQFSVDGGALHGTARGQAVYQAGDAFVPADFQAVLTGTADATPPVLVGPKDAVDALAGTAFEISEPLPASATATLVGMTSGDVVPLAAGDVHDVGHGQVVTGFRLNGFALRWGETYTMKVDAVADFAGLAASAASAPTFKTRAAPPLVPEDGFDSATTRMLGGAGVLRGAPLTPISGDSSLILNTGFGGGFGFLPYMLGPAVELRLAVEPGDTVVKFQRQIVAVGETQSARFYGGVTLGALGAEYSYGPLLEATDLVKVTLPQDGDVWISGIATLEVPLPAGVGNEVTFSIRGDPAGCGVPPLPTALIIDELRVE